MTLTSSSFLRASCATIFITFCFNVRAARPEVSSQSTPERDYRLFVGLDVEIGRDNQYATIEGYVNNRVRTNLSEGLVSLRHADDIRFTHLPKLSRHALVVEHLNAKQITSTVKAARAAMRTQQALQAYQGERSIAIQNEINQLAANAEDTESPEFREQMMAIEDEQRNFAEFTSKTSDPSALIENMDSHRWSKEKTAPAALLVTALVSSPILISDAYLVGTARISTEETVGEDVFFFSRIGRLGEKPKQIRVVKDGMPKEFKVLDVKIHIYRNGKELVTDRSEKQFALNYDEVLEYLTLDRISNNRGETLPPEPAWTLAPEELFASNASDDFNYPMTVEVDARGKVTAIDSTLIVPEHVAKIVKELPFFPGLENGVAVAATTQVNLASFFN